MEFILTFAEDPRDFDLGFGEVTVIHTDYDPYTGEYEVTPKRQEQKLLTKGKNMTDDVTVHEVPWAEVSNPSGTTVIIASE